jgi:hypothetical protein
MKIEITEKKLRAALQIAFAEHGLEDESILDTIETYIKALSITAVVQVCENCKTPTIKGNLCHPCKVDPDLSNE